MGERQQISCSCVCFLIARPSLIIYRHALYQIEAEHHYYPMTSEVSCNSWELKFKIVRGKEV